MNKVLLEDVKWIEKLAAEHFSETKPKQIQRLGGMTNHSYAVTISDSRFVIRLPGEGTEQMINRRNEKASTQLACDLMVDVPMILFDENSGVKIMEYLDHAETMSPQMLREENNLTAATELFRILHHCGKDTGIRFEVFEMAENYEKVIFDNNVRLYMDYPSIRNRVMQLKQKTDRLMVEKVPCHNDPLCENWIQNDERMYLIDWEYAGMNDPMWDLADLSIEAEYTHKIDEQLLFAYLGGSPSEKEWLRFHANKIYLDFLWSLWGKTRVPFDGEEMEVYALHRYKRLKDNLEKINTAEKI